MLKVSQTLPKSLVMLSQILSEYVDGDLILCLFPPAQIHKDITAPVQEH